MSKIASTKSIKHLMRRAGFSAPHDLLENLCNQTYEETVEQLLDPENQPEKVSISRQSLL